jgi:DNA-binding PadR family transcriptional regulator
VEVRILNADIVGGFLQDMRRGAAIPCVLEILKEPAYGYNLVARLADAGLPIEANTLYPLLRRMEEKGLLASTWNTTDGAKPRKYYATTPSGMETLGALKTHWHEAVANTTKILEG